MAGALPLYDLKIKEADGVRWVWGILRKKWLVLTPEEYVRQCLILYLQEEKGFPSGLLSIERGVEVHGLQRRYDLLAYDRNAQPLLCCECKAPEVPIDEKALRQLTIYNSKIQAKHLLLTNGKVLIFLFRTPQNTFKPLSSSPGFSDLI